MFAISHNNKNYALNQRNIWAALKINNPANYQASTSARFHFSQDLPQRASKIFSPSSVQTVNMRLNIFLKFSLCRTNIHKE